MSANLNSFDVDYLTNLTASGRTGHFYNVEEIVSQLIAHKPSPITVQMTFDVTELVINDRLTGESMERIPYTNISQVQMRTTPAMDSYSRLTMFVVNDSFNLVPPEFYIFSCRHESISPQEFVSKLNVAISNKVVSKPRPPVASKPVRNTIILEEEAQRAANATIKFREKQPSRLQSPWMQTPPVPQNEEHIVVKADDYLNILNHCFDDIETFIARLQSAAEAYKELERRREHRKGISGQGDGMLIFRSQPPPKEDFVNVFQKIKLTLNLLPKLKGQVKNPNAPEMAHYIFTPLEFICEASVTNVLGQRQMLADRVITPLLTPETIQFLDDCLVTKEMDLLKSLGHGWNTSSANIEYWSSFGDLPAYIPVFFDGWSPPQNWLFEIAPRIEQQIMRTKPQQNNVRQAASMLRNSLYVESPSKRQSMLTKTVSQPSTPSNDVSLQEEFRQQITAKGGTLYRAVFDWVAKKETELDVCQGDYVEVMEVHLNWCKVRNISGLIGFLPTNVIKLIESGNNTGFPGPSSSQSEYEFESSKIYSDLGNSALNNLNKELAQHVLVSDLPKRKPKEQIAALTEKSTPAEVASWLQAKEFSQKVQSDLADVGGKELFRKEKVMLERMFGADEGSRLYSQILVQRRQSGHETVRAQELSKILNMRKQKADNDITNIFNQPGRQNEEELSNHF